MAFTVTAASAPASVGALRGVIVKREEDTMSTTEQELREEVERLRAQVAHEHEHALTFKVAPKGGASVYGLQKFPVTLYVEQWERLFEALPELKAFLAENEHRLVRKPR